MHKENWWLWKFFSVNFFLVVQTPLETVQFKFNFNSMFERFYHHVREWFALSQTVVHLGQFFADERLLFHHLFHVVLNHSFKFRLKLWHVRWKLQTMKFKSREGNNFKGRPTNGCVLTKQEKIHLKIREWNFWFLNATQNFEFPRVPINHFHAFCWLQPSLFVIAQFMVSKITFIFLRTFL